MPISEDDPFYFISQTGTLQIAYNKISPVVWVWFSLVTKQLPLAIKHSLVGYSERLMAVSTLLKSHHLRL